MPPYRYHVLFNAVLIISIAIILNHFQLLTLHIGAPFIAGYYLGTCWITPDLDTNSKAYNGHGLLWRILWNPYKRFWKHRGNSHKILAGIFVRLLYLSIVLAGILWVCVKLLDMPQVLSGLWLAIQINMIFIGVVLAGITIANIGHIIADGIFSS